MAELSREQQRALAVARARERAAQAQVATPQAAPAEEPGGIRGFIQRDAARAEAFLDNLTNMATFGYGAELEGLEDQFFGRDTYEGGREEFEQRLNAQAESHPISSTAGSVAGAVMPAVGAGRAGLTLLSGPMGVGQAAVRGGLEGAAYGGLHGSGAAEPGERLSGMVHGGLAGAAVGAPLAAGAQGVVNALTRRAAVNAAPAVDDIERQGNAAYSQLRAQGPVFQHFDNFANQARQALHQNGFRPRNHPALERALQEIEEVGARGVPIDFDEIQSLRTMLNNVGQPGSPDARLAKILRDGLDTYTAQSGAPGAAQARETWSRFKKSQQIGDTYRKAQRQAAKAYSGGNVENAIRQRVASILDSPKKRQGFSKDELDLMEQVVGTDEGMARQALRTLAKMSPQGSGLMAMLSGVGGGIATGATMNPIFLAPAVVGMGAKALSDTMKKSDIATLAASVRSGRPIPQAGQSEASNAVVRALASQAGENNEPVIRGGRAVGKSLAEDRLIRALLSAATGR